MRARSIKGFLPGDRPACEGGLSDGALAWVLHGARRAGPARLDELALATLQRWFAPASSLPEQRPYRPAALAPMAARIAQWPYRDLPELKSEHVVQRGENLSIIAREVLGDPLRCAEIFAANRDRLEDPDMIMPGMRLRITGKRTT